MENTIYSTFLLILGILGVFILYQGIKNWKFVLSYLLMPLAGFLAMALFLTTSQFNESVHPVLLGMAGVCIGGLMGHLLALRKKW